jgi:hypothetical protein
MLPRNRILRPIITGLLGSAGLTGLYFGIVSWAESPAHAAEFFWQDRWIVIPIIIGFGIQLALYVVLKRRLYMRPIGEVIEPQKVAPASGASIGTSGTTSTIAMFACCAHHITDVLPILGLTAAATFLARYRLAFMAVGLGTTLLGIGYMLLILIRERRRVENMLRATIKEESL